MPREEVFEVFARIAPGDPMSHVGTLNAPHIDLACVYAWKIYDEEDWHEMWVVARRDIAVASPAQVSSGSAGAPADDAKRAPS